MTWSTLDWSGLAQAAMGGTIVLALGSLAAKACRQPAHRARVVVLTVVGCLVVPWLGVLPIIPRWSAGVLPVSKVEAVANRPIVGPARAPEQSIPDLSGVAPRVNPPWMARPIEPGPMRVAEAVPRPWRVPPASWPKLVLAAHALATLGLAAWWAVGQAMLWRVVRGARPAPDRVRDLLLAISGPEGEGVRLLESDRIALPFTFTWARPTILLPSEFCLEAGSEELRYALAHEWSHVERHDYRDWLVVALAELLLFYQPLFWWLRRQLRLSQDFLADDRAAALGSPEAYAAFLVRLARRRALGASLPALGIGDRRSNLHRRVVMLVQDREPWERRCRTSWAIAASIVAASVMIVASGVRLDASPAGEGPKAVDKPEAKAAIAAQPSTPGAREWVGRIVDKETGQSIAGARVLVRISSSRDARTNGWREIREAVSQTKADGQYRFAISPEEAADRYLYVTLEVDHPEHVRYFGGYGYGMILKNETLGERPFFEKLELWPARAIEGRVEGPDGGPAVGVMVQSYSSPHSGNEGLKDGSFAQTRTDADGRFRIPLHREGQAVFWLLPEQAEPSAHPLRNNRRGDLGTFALARGVRFRGRMLDAQGNPVGGIYVSAGRDSKNTPEDPDIPRSVADLIHRAVLTAEDGTFAMGPLPPGTYRVIPDERGWDPATREGAKDPVRRPLPAVFTAQKVVLEEGKEPEPVEIRAVPHVVVEAQIYNSKGEKRPGNDVWFSGQFDGGFWSTNSEPNAEGTYRIMAPHGLENAQIGLTTNEHSSLVFRKSKEAPLEYGRDIPLGTLDHDVKGIEIIRYVAPVILIKPTGKDGHPLKGLQITVNYAGRPEGRMGGGYILKGGAHSDVNLEEQGDGRFRTSQMSPDREVVVTARAEGFEPSSRTLTLPEGKTEEVDLILSPTANPDPAKPEKAGGE